jgi:hypothetical protein
MKTTAKLWLGLGVLMFLSPLGLLLPAYFNAGPAWGEWSTAELRELVGYIPHGLKSSAGLWQAPFPDYAFQEWKATGLAHGSFAYIVSALAGIALIAVVMLLIGKLLIKKQDEL